MPTTWNKVYRGGVQRTTPETREVVFNGSPDAVILPGMGAVLSAATGISTTVASGNFFYLVGEQLHGEITDNQVSDPPSTLRLYTPRSGDLYAGCAAAGVNILDDAPLTINSQGRWAEAGEDDPIFAYIDAPASAHPRPSGVTTLDQLIPIKIK